VRFRRNMREACRGGDSWRGRVACLGVLAGLALCAARLAAADALPPEPVTATGVRDALDKLLGELRARQLVPDAETELRRVACQALLDAFASGGVVVANEATGGVGAVSAAPVLARVESRAGHFGYLQIAAVEAGLAEAVSAARAPLAGSIDDGTVVDLRESAGNDLEAAAACAALIGSWEHAMVVIVNGHTRAAAEVLAARLRAAHGAVILGEPTRGLPYPLRPVRLAGNLNVMLPEVPAASRVDPLQPDVPVAASAAGDSGPGPRAGSAAPAEGERDTSVRQALDLLTAIRTFQQKHF
jgi:hypothetical protein